MADRITRGREGSAMPWRTARNLAGTLPRPLPAERATLAESLGRVLAAEIRAVTAAPAFDTAAMDGYAVAGAGPWQVLGQVRAGGAGWPDVLVEGTAVEIGTGALLPTGAERVVPYEECQRKGEQLVADSSGRDHIRRAGEDTRPGEAVAPAGRVITSAVLAAAVQAGVEEVEVVRRPRVCVLITGDEVVSHPVLAAGQVRDALSPIIRAVTARAGGETVACRLLGDDADLLHNAIESAGAEVVAVTGSSSIGMADHLHPVLDRLGAQVHVDGVQCRPGRPQALAQTGDGRWVVGLPGNPLAGLVGALTMLEPLVSALAGRATAASLWLPVIGEIQPYPHATRPTPVQIEQGCARAVPGSRAASLRTVAVADALAIIEPDWVDGSPAELLPLP